MNVFSAWPPARFGMLCSVPTAEHFGHHYGVIYVVRVESLPLCQRMLSQASVTSVRIRGERHHLEGHISKITTSWVGLA